MTKRNRLWIVPLNSDHYVGESRELMSVAVLATPFTYFTTLWRKAQENGYISQRGEWLRTIRSIIFLNFASESLIKKIYCRFHIFNARNFQISEEPALRFAVGTIAWNVHGRLWKAEYNFPLKVAPSRCLNYKKKEHTEQSNSSVGLVSITGYSWLKRRRNGWIHTERVDGKIYLS